MFLIPLSDLFDALATLQKLIAIRWWRDHENREEYLDIRRDIQILEQNFYALQEATREILLSYPELESQPFATSPTPFGLSQILGNFNEALGDCWELFGEQESLPSHDWHPPGKDDVVLLHDRIVALNIKLSTVLSSLNLSSFNESLQYTITSSTPWPGKQPYPNDIRLREGTPDPVIFQAGDLKSTRLPGDRRGSVSQAVVIPKPIDRTLSMTMTARHGGLAFIPVIEGVNEIIFYLDQATHWHERRRAPANLRNNHSCKVAYIMWAHWLLRAVQAADEYQAATSTLASGDPQLKLPYYGMTLPRFFSKMGEKILQVYQLLLSEKSDPYPATHLQSNIERERNTWVEYFWHSATQRGPSGPRQGERIMRGRLKTPDPAVKEYLEVFSEDMADNADACLDLIISATNRSDRIFKMDLGWVHVGPNPDSLRISSSIYPLILKQNRSSTKERGDPVTFLRKKDLFRFQELVTGYQVVDDFPEIQITCQYSQSEDKWKVWKGTQSTETSRIQLWNSTNRPQPGAGGRASQLWASQLWDTGSILSSKRDSNLTLTTTRPVSIISIPSIASKAPRLPPLPFSYPSALSVQSSAVSARVPSITRTSSFRTATATSVSTTRPTSITSIVPIDKSGNVGAIIEAPDCPCLVIFLHDMLLVIDMDDEINVTPRLCDCPEEEEQTGYDTLRLPRCTKVVLKATNKYISCKRTPQPGLAAAGGRTTTAGWNIASAGRYQRDIPDCLEEAKKLRLVTLEFGLVEERLRFVKHFKDLQDLRKVNRRG